VNDLEALDTAETGCVWDVIFLKFFSHPGATGLGPTADRCTRVCNYFSMTWRPLGTAGTGSVWDDIFLKFFFHSEASGLNPAAN
jgi:hypothetical protein